MSDFTIFSILGCRLENGSDFEFADVTHWNL